VGTACESQNAQLFRNHAIFKIYYVRVTPGSLGHYSDSGRFKDRILTVTILSLNYRKSLQANIGIDFENGPHVPIPQFK
jgi:hypothetical protein